MPNPVTVRIVQMRDDDDDKEIFPKECIYRRRCVEPDNAIAITNSMSERDLFPSQLWMIFSYQSEVASQHKRCKKATTKLCNISHTGCA